MPDTICCNIRLFADDPTMYLTVSNQSDFQALQADLANLEKWDNKWLMSFNSDKYEVVRELQTNWLSSKMESYTWAGNCSKIIDC